MPFSSPFSPTVDGNLAPGADPRLQPSPDYGTLGPGSDVAGLDRSAKPGPRKQNSLASMVIAGAIGVFVAILLATSRAPHPAWAQFFNFSSPQKTEPASEKDLGQLDRMKPQRQAETLLELAVGHHSQGAVEQISARVDRWHGKVQWNPQIASLTTAALNSNDMRVRESGVEVELAAYGLSKNTASLDYLLRTAESPDHAQKVWALWALGLMANRRVEAGRVVEGLNMHLHDADPDSRRWAVEGLALAGTDDAIQPLLATMHDDPAPMVRERAACSLAESGLFTREQRWLAVPQLLSDTDDPALDVQTHAWAFQALRDISGQRLTNDPAAWRSWYEKQVARGQ